MPVLLAYHPPGTLHRLRSRPLPHGAGSGRVGALRRMHEASSPRGLRRVREVRSPAGATSRREIPVPSLCSSATSPRLRGLWAGRAAPTPTGNHFRTVVWLVLECPTVRPLRRLRRASSTGWTPRRRIRLVWVMLAPAYAPAVCSVRGPHPQAEAASGPAFVSAMLPRVAGARVHPVRSTAPLRHRAARGIGVPEMLAVAALGRTDGTVSPDTIHGGARPTPVRSVRPGQVDQNPTHRRGCVPGLRRTAAGGVCAVRVPSRDHPGSRGSPVPTMFLSDDPDLPYLCRDLVLPQPRHDEGPMPELSPSTVDCSGAGRRGRAPSRPAGAFRRPARGLRRPCASPPVAPAWACRGRTEGHGSRTSADQSRDPR